METSRESMAGGGAPGHGTKGRSLPGAAALAAGDPGRSAGAWLGCRVRVVSGSLQLALQIAW